MTGTRVHDRRLCPVLLCTTTMHHIVLASIPQGEGAGKRFDWCSQHGSGPRRVQRGADIRAGDFGHRQSPDCAVCRSSTGQSDPGRRARGVELGGEVAELRTQVDGPREGTEGTDHGSPRRRVQDRATEPPPHSVAAPSRCPHPSARVADRTRVVSTSQTAYQRLRPVGSTPGQCGASWSCTRVRGKADDREHEYRSSRGSRSSLTATPRRDTCPWRHTSPSTGSGSQAKLRARPAGFPDRWSPPPELIRHAACPRSWSAQHRHWPPTELPSAGSRSCTPHRDRRRWSSRCTRPEREPRTGARTGGASLLGYWPTARKRSRRTRGPYSRCPTAPSPKHDESGTDQRADWPQPHGSQRGSLQVPSVNAPVGQ